jgi:hypothetical protein
LPGGHVHRAVIDSNLRYWTDEDTLDVFAHVWPDEKGGFQISPDRNRALALLVTFIALVSAVGIGIYRAHQPKKSAGKQAAPVKPVVRSWAPAPIVIKPDPPAAAGSLVPPSVPANVPGDIQGESRRYQLTPEQEARWPVKGPEPLPGALLPDHLIVAFYGNPISPKMGILGQLPPEEMLPRLEAAATEWAKVERGRKVLPALHAVVTVAQGQPGKSGLYRLRHSDELIEKVLSWAEDRRWIVFLDVQIGGSSVAAELPRLVKYLERPGVHLALDPEYAMQPGSIPGRRVGTLDAAQVNEAVQLLATIVDRQHIPPKVLVIHRFSQGMLTNYRQIKLDRRVQVVVNMDGFGTPRIKEDAYKSFIALQPVQFTGFKLFYKKDRPMMPPERVLGLTPKPVYIQYQ